MPESQNVAAFNPDRAVDKITAWKSHAVQGILLGTWLLFPPAADTDTLLEHMRVKARVGSRTFDWTLPLTLPQSGGLWTGEMIMR